MTDPTPAAIARPDPRVALLETRLRDATTRLAAVTARLAARLERAEVRAFSLSPSRCALLRALRERPSRAADLELSEFESELAALERFASTLRGVP